jgi:hypothetical protein
MFFFSNEKTSDYKVWTSDGKRIEGFLYVKLENLKTKYFSKTDRFSSSDLLQIKSEVNQKLPSEKMLIYSSVVNDSVQVGLYNIRIVDIDKQKVQQYFGLNADLGNEIKSMTFPVLKFKNDVKINMCFRCSDQELKEAKKIVENFKLEYSKMFNSADLEAIDSSFTKGIKTYAGHGRYRD